MRAFAGRRILMLLENNPYPQDVRVRREAQSLVRAGYSVTVVSPAASDQPRSELVDGVAVYRYPAPSEADSVLGFFIEYGYSMIAIAIITLYVFVRSGFDAIHAHNPPDTFVFIAVWYRLFGVRFVFDHHDLSPEMYEARFPDRSSATLRRTLLTLERLTFRFADHVIATNDSYRTIAIERGGMPSERVTVVRNGPSLDRVRLVEPDPELRGDASVVIGYVGAMGPQDGVDYLIRSIDRLVRDQRRTDFVCYVIGQGSAVPSLKALTRDMDLDQYVRFTGRISDQELMRHLSTADICVDPDPYSPFTDKSTMIKMTEYMALGRPIVCFDLTEHRYTAADAALYAEPNDESDFARLLAELMDDPKRRLQMGEAGKRRIEEELAWPFQETHLLHAYQQLLPLED